MLKELYVTLLKFYVTITWLFCLLSEIFTTKIQLKAGWDDIYALKKIYLIQKPPQVYCWCTIKKKNQNQQNQNKPQTYKLKLKLAGPTAYAPTFCSRCMIFSLCNSNVTAHFYYNQWQICFKSLYHLLLRFVLLLQATILQLCWLKCLLRYILYKILSILLIIFKNTTEIISKPHKFAERDN